MPSTRILSLRHLVVGLVLIVPAVTFADDDASRQLVNKALEKTWGSKFDKSKAITSKLKGNVQVNEASVPFTGEVNTQRGDQHRIAITLTIDGQAIEFASIVNGNQGWLKINDNSVDMPADKLTDSKEAAYAAWVTSLLPLKDKEFKLAPFGEIEIGGRKAAGVNVTREGHRSITLFFDKESSLLVRTETVVRDEVSFKEVTEEVTYSNHKAFDGVQHPTRIVIKRNGQAHVDAEIEDFKAAEKLDDSMFSKP